MIEQLIHVSPIASTAISAIALIFVVIQMFTSNIRDKKNRQYDLFKSREILRPILSMGKVNKLAPGTTIHFLLPPSSRAVDEYGKPILSKNGVVQNLYDFSVFPEKLANKMVEYTARPEIIDKLNALKTYIADGKTNQNLFYLKNSSENNIYKCILVVDYTVNDESVTETYSFDRLARNETAYFDTFANKLAGEDYTIDTAVMIFETALREVGKVTFNVLATPLREGNIVLNNPKENYTYNYDYKNNNFQVNEIEYPTLGRPYNQAFTHVHKNK